MSHSKFSVCASSNVYTSICMNCCWIVRNAHFSRAALTFIISTVCHRMQADLVVLMPEWLRSAYYERRSCCAYRHRHRKWFLFFFLYISSAFQMYTYAHATSSYSHSVYIAISRTQQEWKWIFGCFAARYTSYRSRGKIKHISSVVSQLNVYIVKVRLLFIFPKNTIHFIQFFECADTILEQKEKSEKCFLQHDTYSIRCVKICRG